MTFSFHPEAETEFRGAIEYYEECEAGLGCDFSLEVFAGIESNYQLSYRLARH